jgi:RimJ/RimL family protein N-acetyltransferase
MRLRAVTDEDVDAFFAHQRDVEANEMAAFTASDPDDRESFVARWFRLRADPSVLLRAIELEGEAIGHVASFDEDGVREVTYWIARGWWGRGVASAALEAFLQEEQARPLRARVAADNLGSRRVLEKNGFMPLARSTAFACARGRDVEEITFELLSRS